MNYLLNLSEEEIINLNNRVDYYSYSPMRDGFIIPEDCYSHAKDKAMNYYLAFVDKDANNEPFYVPEYDF